MLRLVEILLGLIIAPAQPQPSCPADALRYSVVVEEGIPEPDFDADVHAILTAPDGWSRAGHGTFCPSNDPGFVVLLAWPDTVDEMCAPMRTRGDVSCSRNGRAVINWKRWLNGSSGWSTVEDYRHYVVTHEVGHVLGMTHRRCPADPDAPTPVMRQQTSRKHASCPRQNRPTGEEVESLAELRWSITKIRRRVIKDPWERPPAED
jgi:hypothetical protein